MSFESLQGVIGRCRFLPDSGAKDLGTAKCPDAEPPREDVVVVWAVLAVVALVAVTVDLTGGPAGGRTGGAGERCVPGGSLGSVRGL